MEFQMRNKTFISSMVGVAAAMAVAGSANAAVFTDNFAVPQSGLASVAFSPSRTRDDVSATPWAPYDTTARILFAQNYQTNENEGGSGTLASSSVTSGQANLFLANGLSGYSAAGIDYGLNAFNSTGTDRFILDYSTVGATGLSMWVFVTDTSGRLWGSTLNSGVAGNSKSVTVLYSSFTPEFGSATGAFDWSSMSNFSFLFAAANQVALTQDTNITVTSFSAVPAPGALALLGVAGLVGARRRRA
jgi:MYXO-CTERM domain-containing protein